MIGLRRLWMAAGVGALLVTPLVAFSALTGCGTPGGKVATVQSGDMPSGAKWDGVYFNELYGHLHLKTQGGSHVKGRWQRPQKDRWGDMEGDITGDVIHFTWSEYTTGLVGPNAKRTGKGYFKYKRPEGDNVDDQIVGEIGSGEDEVGDPWEAVKQRRMDPHPENIGGTGAGDVGGGDWDTDSKEKGKPEGPASPH